MTTNKLFRVRFCVRDYYIIELSAPNAHQARSKAQDMYSQQGEEPFEFDISEGGSCDWEAEEVRS